ncbi:MAG: TonB-dependent receptor [Saprospiraceae bacterium]|nr:TonB-dependent receptor [Saprospiraceae bacterium]
MQKLLFSIVVAVISFAAVTAQENVLDRKVNYRATNRDLSNVLVDLSKKSAVNIVFKISDIPEKTINFYSPDYSLKEILDFLLQGSALKYDVVDRQIVIYKPGIDNKEKYFIKGYTIDSRTGEKLIYTNIYLDDFSKGTVSNEHGFFILELYKGKNKVNFSYLGYYKYILEIDLQKDLTANVSLNPEPSKELKEVLITDKRQYNNRMEFYEPDVINIDRIDKMVHLFGEDDILRLTHIQPGVLTGADGFGGIHVRGSSAGDNEIILDGVPVYNAQHAIGLFSVFNSSLIKNSTFLKGNFPARYGGSLGSVLDISTRDGNNKKFGGELDLGLLTIKGLLEGPIVNDKSSMIISFRRTFVDIWNNSISELISSDKEIKKFNYYFYDLNFKFNFHLNDKNHLFLSYYRGGDNFENSFNSYQDIEQDSVISKSDSDWKWGNNLLSAQWHTPARQTPLCEYNILLQQF